MDFDKLDLRQSEGKEYWIHLRLGDALLYSDKEKEKPCRVRVASISQNAVEEALNAVGRARSRQSAADYDYARANRSEREGALQRLKSATTETEGALSQFLITAVRDWENIEKGGEELPFSRDALTDLSQPKGPLYRLAATIAEDMAEAHSPFSTAADN